MTEYEINKAVAEKLGMIFPKLFDQECYDPLSFFDGDDLVKFDPCNNAQQAWEIMDKSHICVLNIGDNYVAFNVKGKSVDKHKLDEKPFVAAMLLFLEI